MKSYEAWCLDDCKAGKGCIRATHLLVASSSSDVALLPSPTLPHFYSFTLFDVSWHAAKGNPIPTISHTSWVWSKTGFARFEPRCNHTLALHHTSGLQSAYSSQQWTETVSCSHQCTEETWWEVHPQLTPGAGLLIDAQNFKKTNSATPLFTQITNSKLPLEKLHVSA